MKTLPKRLSPKLTTLLLMGVKHAGSYQPDAALLGVEEVLTGPELATASHRQRERPDTRRGLARVCGAVDAGCS